MWLWLIVGFAAGVILTLGTLELLVIIREVQYDNQREP